MQKPRTAVLCIFAVLLALTSGAVLYADVLLGRVYRAQREGAALSGGALPVLHATPTPAPTPVPTAAPAPTRAPLAGDLPGVRFPDYDTGAGAAYSYQSDELRIAVSKVEDPGVTYYVADVWMRNVSCFRTAFSSGKYRGRRQDAETISKENQAILAVNGDFLGGLVLRNGVLYRKATVRPETEATPTPTPATYPMYAPTDAVTPTPRPERSTCVLYGDGRMRTAEYADFRSNAAMRAGAWQGWQYGPTLVREGRAVKDVKKQSRNPRCMLGYYEPGHYCLIVIDGRQKGYSVGMNFEEMIDLALRLGLEEAYNMDGGGSAIMTFNGEIINQPSGKGDARNLPDMVVIGEYLAPAQLRTPIPTETEAAS